MSLRTIAWLNIAFSLVAIAVAIAVFTRTAAGLDLREAVLEPTSTISRNRSHLPTAPEEEEPSAIQYYFRTHPLSDLMLVFFALYSAAIAIPSVLNGAQLSCRNSVRARELASICATLQLGSIPIGTALGIVTLWTFLQADRPDWSGRAE